MRMVTVEKRNGKLKKLLTKNFLYDFIMLKNDKNIRINTGGKQYEETEKEQTIKDNFNINCNNYKYSINYNGTIQHFRRPERERI